MSNGGKMPIRDSQGRPRSLSVVVYFRGQRVGAGVISSLVPKGNYREDAGLRQIADSIGRSRKVWGLQRASVYTILEDEIRAAINGNSIPESGGVAGIPTERVKNSENWLRTLDIRLSFL